MKFNRSLEARCQKIIKSITKDFPKLEGIKIHLKIKKLKKGSMYADTFFGFYYRIKVDPDKYADAKDSQIIGGVAHELVHFEDFRDFGFFRHISHMISYYFKTYQKKFERSADIKVIKKGYGYFLMLNRAHRLNKINPKEHKKIGGNYMMPDEIREYIKENKIPQKKGLK